MNTAAKQFLYKLIKTPSPSGYAQKIQKLIQNYVKDFADKVESDLHGNVIAGVNVKSDKRVMLAGHCDHIGFMVKHISDRGFVRVAPLGGIDFGVVPGSRATIHTKKGDVNAVFGRKPIHLQEKNEREVMKLGEKENWLDIGVKDKKEAEKVVDLGDPVTYQLEITELMNSLISAPGLDDRVGCFIAFETLRRCSSKKLNVALYAASTVQEEVGLRGATTAAYNIDPEVGIAIDVTHSTDNPGAKGAKLANITLGDGPTISRGLNTNTIVEKRLIEAAKKAKVAVHTDLCPRPGGNDSAAMQISRGGTATATLGIPCRYMHSKSEVISLQDVENAIKLLVSFISSIQPRTNFKPY